MNTLFENRHKAGEQLADDLTAYQAQDDVIVLGLPRGGVPVAYEVAKTLCAPFDIFTVRKLGVPGHKEMAMGAIATGNARYINRDVTQILGIDEDAIEQVAYKEQQELQRQETLYRGENDLPDLEDSTVILVDDGVATGATMQAAIVALGQHHPSDIIVAAPVTSQKAHFKLEQMVDDIICVLIPERFRSVGLWYRNFSQTLDSEVRDLLQKAHNHERIPNATS